MSLDDIVSLGRQLWVVWLMFLFLGIIFFALRPKNKKKFDEASQIPLQDDD
ncbi:cbb3-type cytochrome oxidase subunit 3 [Terasakiella pusilla]|uniref:cbb3-type cytochrome oxidase subunit 3 n=1 Tax=Terasakiella pusilla TaxID=64973 RepID=UPI001F0AC518|nr:cbb3-type cytochrome c oxidase subunit 3 [Terasakiella pusilla]